jgi:ketosteroid isomerase-like protein
MSEENVEFVLAAYEWGNREREHPSGYWHDDGEYINASEDPDHAAYRGREEIERLFASWMEAFPDIQVQPVEARASGDRVFVWVRFVGHAASSGLPFEMELAQVTTLEDGRVRRLEEFFDRADALKAVGLEE